MPAVTPSSLSLSVTLVAPVASFERVVAFYDAVLQALGLERVSELVDEEEDGADVEAVGWGPSGGADVLWVVVGSRPTTGAHLRLPAGSRVEVETFHDAGVATGGTSRSLPRRWPVFRRGEFSAAVVDPLGNVVEVVGPE